MRKKVITVIIAMATIIVVSVPGIAASYSHNFVKNGNGGYQESIVRPSNGNTYYCFAYARLEDSANYYILADTREKTISSGSCKANCSYNPAHHGYYEASAQNVSYSADHFSVSGRDYA